MQYFSNYCKIDSEKMDYIAEQKTSVKLNKFLPGMKIPIIDEEHDWVNSRACDNSIVALS